MKLHIDRQANPPGTTVSECAAVDPTACLRAHWDACEPCWRDLARRVPTRMQVRGVFLCEGCQMRSREGNA